MEETLAFRRRDVHLMREMLTADDFLAPVLAILLTAACLFAVVRFCRTRAQGRLFFYIRYASFALALIPANGARAVLSRYTKYLKSPLLDLIGPHTLYLIIIPMGLVALWALWTWQHAIVKCTVVGLIALFPFCLFTIGQATVASLRVANYQMPNLPSAPMRPHPNTTGRAIWIIFDEWDWRLVFKDRPAGLQLPAVDRFASESLAAMNVRSPAMETASSVPTMLTGRRIRLTNSTVPARVSAEEIEGFGRLSWSDVPTIFSAARDLGYNTSAIGWYLPYCRMFDSLNDCAWWVMPTQATAHGYTLWAKIYGQTRSLFETDTMSPFGQSLAVKQKTAIYKAFLDRAEHAVSNPALGLVYLHVPAPHAPHFYNRKTGNYDLKNNPLRGYIDSLALVDKMLATLRSDMERSGLWESSAILITSDHPYREPQAIDGKSDPRIPYLLKMPGQHMGMTFTPAFNSVLSANLILGVLSGKLTTAEDAAAWLQQHRTNFEDPLPENLPRTQ